MSEDWSKWEGEVIQGVYPLRRSLGISDHSVVYLTEDRTKNSVDAAIKFVPADPLLELDARLTRWETAAGLAHPHLIKVLDWGRCNLQGHPFLFVVTEYAEQTLAQLLPGRALTGDELRQMLPPTLDALAFLHGKGFIQGNLKPANILVVNDQVKLASDALYEVGETAGGFAGDIWAIGMTIVEALTQRLPERADAQSEIVSLPATLAPEFEQLVRQCLQPNPSSRPTVAEIQALLGARAPAPVAEESQPLVDRVPVRATPSMTSSHKKILLQAIAGLLTVAVVWGSAHLVRHYLNARDAAAAALAASQAIPAAPAPGPDATAPSSNDASADPSLAVLHQEIPKPSAGALESIHGHIKIAVRVTVDRSGKVVEETLVERGQSRYFSRLAAAAARKWTFTPAGKPRTRVLLKFEFSRDGVAAQLATTALG